MRNTDSSRRPTIKEVAQLAGVSFKTVARVANNEPCVSEETRGAVLKTMKQLGYSPNVSARQLRSNRSFLIALASSVAADPSTTASAMYLAGAQPGAVRRCREVGYHLAMEEVSFGAEAAAVKRLEQLRVDGVIVLPPLSQDFAFIKALQSKGQRYVLIASDKYDQSAPMVSIDDRKGSYEMTKLLIKLGHRKIAYISGGEIFASKLRYNGFLDALRDAGISRRAEYEALGDFTFRIGEVCGRKLLSLADRPTAILTGNDEMALGVMVAAARLGFNVPDDLSVAGYDDALFSTIVWPQLTTVRQPLVAMTAKAVDILLDDDLYKASPDVVLDFSIVKRGSTAKPPVSRRAARRR